MDTGEVTLNSKAKGHGKTKQNDVMLAELLMEKKLALASSQNNSNEPMEFNLEENFEAQHSEADALHAIFSPDEFQCECENGMYGGFLKLELQLPDSTVLEFPTFHNADSGFEADSQTVAVTYMPHVWIRFTLPAGYPTVEPPLFSLDCFWLPKQMQSKLKRRLLEIWDEDRCEILFRFADFIQHETLEFLDLCIPAENGVIINIDRIWHMNFTRQEIAGSSSQKPVDPLISRDLLFRLGTNIVQHDAKKNESIFNAALWDCGICLERKRGSLCLRIVGCHHVFCKACLHDCFLLYITEGSVELVTCPDPVCKKAIAKESKLQRPAPLHKSQFEDLVGSAVYKRYLKVVEAKHYEGRSDVVYCPRPNCETPIIRTNPDDKLGICGKCKFAFCVLCQRCWHGYHNYCPISNALEIATKYESATPQEKQQLELRYGKKQLEMYVAQVLAERDTLIYLRENTVGCPTCSTNVEKSFGCNHMTCVVCETHFCFLCGAYLDKRAPYKHFSDTSLACYGRLFENPGDVDNFVFFDD